MGTCPRAAPSPCSTLSNRRIRPCRASRSISTRRTPTSSWTKQPAKHRTHESPQILGTCFQQEGCYGAMQPLHNTPLVVVNKTSLLVYIKQDLLRLFNSLS